MSFPMPGKSRYSFELKTSSPQLRAPNFELPTWNSRLRSREFEVGSSKLGARSWGFEVGSSKLGVQSWEFEVRNSKLAVRSWGLETLWLLIKARVIYLPTDGRQDGLDGADKSEGDIPPDRRTTRWTRRSDKSIDGQPSGC